MIPFLNPTLSTPAKRQGALDMTRARHGLAVWALALLLAWVLAAVAGLDWVSLSGAALNPHGHTHLYAHGHPFVDARAWGGVPNAMDVLSNGPLVLAGGWGLWCLRVSAQRPDRTTRQALQTFFSGLVLTGLGSASYHWSPDALGLVLDRMGMAVTFAGALSLAVAGRIGVAPPRGTLAVLLVLFLLSAAMPLTHGNVAPWLVVQFGGMAFLAWAALQAPVPGALPVRLGWLIVLYALAKLLEVGDAVVFQATGEWVSGHSLKHGMAALAAWPVIHAVRQNAPPASPKTLK